MAQLLSPLKKKLISHWISTNLALIDLSVSIFLDSMKHLLILFAMLALAVARRVLYWGKGSESQAKRLVDVCQSQYIDMVALDFGSQHLRMPRLRLERCNKRENSVYECQRFADDIAACQKLGIEIMMVIRQEADIFRVGPNATDTLESYSRKIHEAYGRDRQIGAHRPFLDASVDGYIYHPLRTGLDRFPELPAELRKLDPKSIIAADVSCVALMNESGNIVINNKLDIVFVLFEGKYCDLNRPFPWRYWESFIAENRFSKLKIIPKVPASQVAGGASFALPLEAKYNMRQMNSRLNFDGIAFYDEFKTSDVRNLENTIDFVKLWGRVYHSSLYPQMAPPSKSTLLTMVKPANSWPAIVSSKSLLEITPISNSIIVEGGGHDKVFPAGNGKDVLHKFSTSRVEVQPTLSLVDSGVYGLSESITEADELQPTSSQTVGKHVVINSIVESVEVLPTSSLSENGKKTAVKEISIELYHANSKSMGNDNGIVVGVDDDSTDAEKFEERNSIDEAERGSGGSGDLNNDSKHLKHQPLSASEDPEVRDNASEQLDSNSLTLDREATDVKSSFLPSYTSFFETLRSGLHKFLKTKDSEGSKLPESGGNTKLALNKYDPGSKKTQDLNLMLIPDLSESPEMALDSPRNPDVPLQELDAGLSSNNLPGLSDASPPRITESQHDEDTLGEVLPGIMKPRKSKLPGKKSEDDEDKPANGSGNSIKEDASYSQGEPSIPIDSPSTLSAAAVSSSASFAAVASSASSAAAAAAAAAAASSASSASLAAAAAAASSFAVSFALSFASAATLAYASASSSVSTSPSSGSTSPTSTSFPSAPSSSLASASLSTSASSLILAQSSSSVSCMSLAASACASGFTSSIESTSSPVVTISSTPSSNLGPADLTPAFSSSISKFLLVSPSSPVNSKSKPRHPSASSKIGASSSFIPGASSEVTADSSMSLPADPVYSSLDSTEIERTLSLESITPNDSAQSIGDRPILETQLRTVTISARQRDLRSVTTSATSSFGGKSENVPKIDTKSGAKAVSAPGKELVREIAPLAEMSNPDDGLVAMPDADDDPRESVSDPASWIANYPGEIDLKHHVLSPGPVSALPSVVKDEPPITSSDGDFRAPYTTDRLPESFHLPVVMTSGASTAAKPMPKRASHSGPVVVSARDLSPSARKGDYRARFQDPSIPIFSPFRTPQNPARAYPMILPNPWQMSRHTELVSGCTVVIRNPTAVALSLACFTYQLIAGWI